MTQFAPIAPLVGLTAGSAPQQQQSNAPATPDLGSLNFTAGNFLREALRDPDPAQSLMSAVITVTANSIQKEAEKQAEIQKQQDQRKAEEEAAKATAAQAEADKAARLIASADTPAEIKEAQSITAQSGGPRSFIAVGAGTRAQNEFTTASIELDREVTRVRSMVLEAETTAFLGEQTLPFSRFGTKTGVSVTAADGTITLAKGTKVTIDADGSMTPEVGTVATIRRAVMDHKDGTPPVRFEGLPVEVDRPIKLDPIKGEAGRFAEPQRPDRAAPRVLQQAA